MTIPGEPPRLILIVEDDEDARHMLKDILEVEGYAVEGVVDGQAALDRAARAPRPALIVLDVMMPGIGGIRFLELRSADAALTAIPVVVVTASGLSCVGHNVLGVLSKPLNVPAFLAVVDQACGRPQA